MKYEVQEMMIVDNVEDALVDEWVSITIEKIESIRSSWSIERMSRRSTQEERSINQKERS